MTQEQINSIQQVQIGILKEIHHVCIEQGYRYYLIGGSALGAVRHKGIIPWDVDIDIAMPRADYQKFITEGSKYLDEKLSIHYYATDKDFATVHALVALKDSSIRFRGESPAGIRYGIFVDVLPLDQWPEDRDLKIQQQKDLKKIQMLRALRFGVIYGTTNPLKSIVKKTTKRIMSIFYTKRTLNERQQTIMQRHNRPDEGKEWCSMVSHYSFDKTTFPKEVFGTPRLYEFSGHQFFVPEKVEDYLAHLFGDYMKFPSEESRIKLMNSVLYASWVNDDNERITIESK